ncbi:MATE family efflux transporter, partial [Thalassospira xiamenensis]
MQTANAAYSKTAEWKQLAKLTGPILVAQLTQTLMSVVDTVMAGQVSATDLAAVSVGSSIWIPAILLVFGLALALAPIISHFDGAKDHTQVANMVQQGFYVCVLGGLVTYAAIASAPWLLDMMTVEDKFRQVTLDYLKYIVWGLPAFVIYIALRNFCE